MGKNNNMHVQRTFKSGFNMPLSTAKEFDITFRTTEGFLNYWIMYDQFEEYLSYGQDDDIFLPDIQLQILDHYGYLMMTRVYHKCVMTTISELELSYSSNVPEYKMFSIGFSHNGVSVKKELD